MDSTREAQLREGCLLYRAEAAEVWAALDEARAEIERLRKERDSARQEHLRVAPYQMAAFATAAGWAVEWITKT